jgi:hypothetical protein
VDGHRESCQAIQNYSDSAALQHSQNQVRTTLCMQFSTLTTKGTDEDGWALFTMVMRMPRYVLQPQLPRLYRGM